jgi:hypothetical protein
MASQRQLWVGFYPLAALAPDVTLLQQRLGTSVICFVLDLSFCGWGL